MNDIILTVQGTERVSMMFKRKYKRAENLAPIFQILVRDFRSIMTRQFDSAGRELGTPWPALSRRTIEDKQRDHRDPRILHRTRRLRKSFSQGSKGDSYRVITPTTFAIGSSVPYADFHQHGTRRMPQRKLFEANKEVSTRWRIMIQNYLMRGSLRRVA